MIDYETQRLMKEANKSAQIRQHSLLAWKQLSRTVWVTVCGKCEREVSIDTNPPANGIDIGGEAVALDCGIN